MTTTRTPSSAAPEQPRTTTSTQASVEPRGHDILGHRWVRAIITSRFYPGVLQWAVLAVFVFVGHQLLLGPDKAHDNLGTSLMWVLWWPVIPLVFVLLGRFWCAVCPFATLNDWVQKVVGLERPVPPFLKKYGIWLIDASFIAITWSDHVWGIVSSPWGSGILVLLLTTAVVVSGALWQRRAFCRYLCFLGGLSGNYARTGMLALRADQDVCRTCTSRAACYNGTDKVAGCPLSSFPRTMDSNANCNLCANCVKSCPNDAISISVRKPTQELWFIRTPKVEESFLAMAIMGIVLIQNVTMLQVWPDALDAISQVFGTDNDLIIFTLAFVIALSVPVGMLALAARIASRAGTESVRQNFARFGYALIPLDVAGHVAHNLFHLLAEGKSVWLTAMPLFGASAPEDTSAALVGMGTIQVLQYAVLALGIAGSLYTARRIAHRRYRTQARRRAVLTPYVALIAALGAANVILFLLPMAHRV